MIEIKYNKNPNNPKEYDHLGIRSQMVEESSKSFKDLDKAINFWMECTWPITQLTDIDHRKWVKKFNKIKKTEGIEAAECYYNESKKLIVN